MSIDKLVRQIEKVPAPILIWLLLCIRFANFQLIGNEEQYFALARHYMDPEWIKGAFPLQEFTGTRIIFETIAGIILQHISFEAFAFWGRIMVFLFMAIPLGKIFKLLNIPNYIILFILSVYIFKNQALFAHEWIFMGIEAKSLAYIFIFWALYKLFKNKNYHAIIFTALATYFHVLVGGWFLIYLIFFLLLEKQVLTKIIKSGLLFLIITLPFIIFLVPTYINDTETTINGINTNWIYAYYRNAHHLAPFESFHKFYHYFFPGILITIVLYSLCIFLFSKIENMQFRKLNNLNIAIFSFQLLFVIISFFDKNGALLKYYPFRSSALSLFLILIEFALYIKINHGFIGKTRWITISRLKSVILLVSFILVSFYTINSTLSAISYHKEYKNRDVQVIAEFFKKNTDKEDVILSFVENDEMLPLLRKSERKLFVLFKFVPTTSELLYQWYTRNELSKQVKSNHDLIVDVCSQYQVNYVVSDDKINSRYYKELLSSQRYFVYEVQCPAQK